ncbi:AfsR/SARP family transcriptional regulator [Micromonospora soli]|uniref:AfsR/SARP family transcriptional regulator n=1 Tax=Micromonospora sp. NBRC 110009 TaxID=3061627 RepID=UPI0026711C64|nr:AfsR/SARP family transcriptional regulator [Micromonospora sp. NBRC 110009]WKU01551.1 AfsR/SARP family transcriptional regulator [Micromonospora sp. NBRC 110009]
MSPPPAPLRFALLGPQRAWYADRPLDLGPGKQRAVLAVLLLSAGRPVPTGQIVDAVWPEEPPANGPNVVQKYVAGLRRVLEPDRSPRTPGQVLTLTDAGYLLRIPPEAVDAVRFERGVHRARQRHAEGRTDEALAELTGALEQWQGEPFTGFAGPYFDSARHRLVELRAVALETRAELALESGRHRELVGELVELVAEFPVRERLRHQLMLALYRSGRQAEALAAYREFAGLLREEYGIEPGEALQALHGRMLRSDPALIVVDAHQPATVPTSRADTAAVAPEPSGGPPAEDLLPASPRSGVPPEPAAPPGSAVPPPPVAQPGRFVPVQRADPAALVPPGPVGPAVPGGAISPALLVGMPPPFAAPAERQSPRWVPATATVVGTAAALLSFGALTWAVVLGYALWRRSWRLAVAGFGYFLLVASLFVLAVRSGPVDEDAPADGETLYFVIVVGICWAVGSVHVLLLNPFLKSALARAFGSGEQRAAEERRVRREQARHLLQHYPAARHELRIGRPDLLRTFDDGGLVDVNAVPDQVLAGLPGLTGEQRRQIAVDRWARGPYGSLEELGGRCRLPVAATEPLRDLLLFLPPPPPPPGPADPGRGPVAW